MRCWCIYSILNETHQSGSCTGAWWCQPGLCPKHSAAHGAEQDTAAGLGGPPLTRGISFEVDLVCGRSASNLPPAIDRNKSVRYNEKSHEARISNSKQGETLCFFFFFYSFPVLLTYWNSLCLFSHLLIWKVNFDLYYNSKYRYFLVSSIGTYGHTVGSG